MALFQNSVLKKHLKTLDESAVTKQYNLYKTYFLNPTIQDNIRDSKEEEFQATFLNELFVKILGYTLKPNPNFNLTTEFKNVKNSKKADGAILQNGKAIAVIELKGTNTTDFKKIEIQAFGYKNNQPDAVYVITSNFEKLRFYIDNAVNFEEFNLFHLSLERFKILWLCLSHQSIFKGLPKQISDSSLVEEENITKKLYKDYSSFRNQLFQSIIKLNPDHDKLLLFKKTQKLLDRFLFIFFAEDSGLLPPNSIRLIIDQWVQLRDELDHYVPLYSRFKKYFGYMNTGHKGKKHDIFAYNGGLFAPDAILDNIKIDDTILYTCTQKLSAYDFKSEVDVNILGHIFEHSLNEIEELQAELRGEKIEKSKTKRKKDGVFYTPKYITQYIVENTLGKLCEEQKVTLGIKEEEYFKSRKGRKKKTLKALKDKLDAYRDWLLSVTICDPACGSGAFLNQALDFLIKEHRYLDELQTKLLGGGFVFPNVKNTILENNLFGVDINEESIEIAKLSLWLRSAEPKRKLNSLNNNLKCGNSLIDDPLVGGEKAFNWKKEFPTIFERGGFDIIIGNPPYVQIKKNKRISTYLSKKEFFSFEKMGDLYCLFYELGIKILKTNGLLGYITSNKWLRAKYGQSLRYYLSQNSAPKILIDLGSGIFQTATVDSNILIIKKQKVISHNLIAVKFLKKASFYDFIESSNSNKITTLNKNPWIIISKVEQKLKTKIEKIGVPLKDWNLNFYRGIQTGNNDIFIINQKLKNKLIQEDPSATDLIKPILGGKNIGRYHANFNNNYLIYTNDETNIKDYPSIYSYLSSKKRILETKLEVQQGKMIWYSLYRPAKKHIHEFEKEKLIFSKASREQSFFLDLKLKAFTLNTSYIATGEHIKSLIAILNSKLAKFIFLRFYQSGGIVGEITIQAIQKIPIPKFPLGTQKSLENITKTVSNLVEVSNKKQKRFFKRVADNLNLINPEKTLSTFYNYDFKTFLSKLKKKKIKLTLVQQDEWEEYFNAYKTEINQLQTEIEKTDKEIDKMVYELYGLTEEEIKIVEES